MLGAENTVASARTAGVGASEAAVAAGCCHPQSPAQSSAEQEAKLGSGAQGGPVKAF